MSKLVASKFSFGQTQGGAPFGSFGLGRKKSKRKKKKKDSVGRSVADFFVTLTKEVIRDLAAQQGEMAEVEDPAQVVTGGGSSEAEEQLRKGRGGRESGTPNEKTQSEILAPYDKFRASGLDDMHAQSKVVALLIPKSRETLGELKSARRRVSRAVERYRGDECARLEEACTSGKVRRARLE
jgi:hypothetical protein